MKEHIVPSGAKALVVDDNSQLLKSLDLKLTRDGFAVSTAESGDEAVSLLRGGLVPDILLTDAVMPGHVQGWDLARYSKEKYPSVPVIMMSGYARPFVSEEDNCSEIDCFLAKPLGLAAVSEELRLWLVKSNSAVELKVG